jgi:hypothetical protein
LFFTDAGKNVRAMMAGGLSEDSGAVKHSAALGVLRGEAERFHSGERNCCCAHCARLERYPQRASIEA